MRHPFSSVHAKTFAVISGLTFVLVAFFVTYFPARQIALVREAMEDRAAAYGRLLSRQVEPGVAYDDAETVREVFASASADRDIRGLALYRNDGTLFVMSGRLESEGAPAKGTSVTARVESTRKRVRAVASVLVKERPRGTLVLEMSTDRIESERAAIQRLALAVGAGALLVGLLAAWVIGRSLALRLRAIGDATRAVADGDLAQVPVADSSGDEVGQLARSFNRMRVNVKVLLEQLQATSEAERERATQLCARTNEMRLVLDHIGQGLFMADADGIISAERSRALDDLLGPPEPGATLWSYVSSVDDATGAWLRLGWDALKEGFLPFELSLDQLPKSIHKGNRHFKIEYEPILVEGAMTKLLVVVSDMTAQLARERADAAQRELIALFERVTRDRAGVQEFFVEGANLVHRILTATTLTPDLRRAIHTLKGNGALFGLTSISDLCHTIENNIADTGAIPSDGERTELGARWREIVQKISTLLDQLRTARIEIEETDYDSLMQGIVRGVPRRTLAHDVWLWRLEPLSRRLERIAQHARNVAPRLGKANVTILTEHNGLRLDTKAWTPFWAAFVHVVRNALDHGVESEAERTKAGKAGAGAVAIRTYLSGSEFIVEVADDGRGIHWDAVRARGAERGLPHETRAELEALLFVDGVSTKTEATEISGRGVGLGAVRAACIALGGEVRLRTSPGEGTVFDFGFPIAAMGDNFVEPEIAPSQSSGSLGSRRGPPDAAQGATATAV